MLAISIELNIIFLTLALAFAYRKKDKITEKLKLYIRGGADLQKRLWPNLIRIS